MECFDIVVRCNPTCTIEDWVVYLDLRGHLSNISDNLRNSNLPEQFVKITNTLPEDSNQAHFLLLAIKGYSIVVYMLLNATNTPESAIQIYKSQAVEISIVWSTMKSCSNHAKGEKWLPLRYQFRVREFITASMWHRSHNAPVKWAMHQQLYNT